MLTHPPFAQRALLLGAFTAWIHPQAAACTFGDILPYKFDDASADVSPPMGEVRVSVEVERGYQDCGRCIPGEAFGWLRLWLEELPVDDVTAPESLGYIVETESGDASPIDRHELWGEPARPQDGLMFTFVDDHPTRNIKFTGRITPFDKAGNAGEPTLFEVDDRGKPDLCRDRACDSTSPGPMPLVALLLAALGALRRRAGL